jgi:predicted TIM-barrel fold metal-dependent hydrolase
MQKFADSHIHFYDFNYDRAVGALASMHSLGVTDTAVMSLAAYPSGGVAQNLFALHVKNAYKGPVSLRAFASLHELDVYKDIPYEKQLDAMLKMGFDGMKFIHMKPNSRSVIGKGICDPSYDGVLGAMEERGTPMVMHSGDPAWFWDKSKVTPSIIERGWFYGDESVYLPYQAYYDEVYAMLDKHPRLNLTMAHMFFLADNYDEAIRVLETYPNLKFDLTPAWEIYAEFAKDKDKWHDFFEKYADRLMFGTDSSDRSSEQSIKNLHDTVYLGLTRDDEFTMPVNDKYMMVGLGVSDSALERICYKNYVRYFGENVAPVDEDMLHYCAERMRSEISDDKEQAASAAWLNGFLSGN